MNEEVSLPLHSPHVHTLYTIGLFVSQSKAVITSVVVLLDDVSILGGLDAASGKVAHVFDCPPEVLLDPELAHSEKLVPVRSEDWPYEADLYVSPRRFCAHMCMRRAAKCCRFLCWAEFQGQLLDRHDYRLHRFQSTASPIKGLMADILVRHTPFLSLCGLLIVIFT